MARRRAARLDLGAVLLLALTAAALAAGPAAAQAPAVAAVEAVGLTVSDAERAIRFYAEVLGFETVSDVGIDHTAIVVGDTEASLRFYRDRLGLRVVGESENHGPEQEHLNLVFGARLRITTLRAAAGSGIELLEYLAPRDGRPIPADQRPNDLAHWQTRLAAPALAARGAVSLPDDALGFRAGLLVRDPDGHAMQLAEREASR